MVTCIVPVYRCIVWCIGVLVVWGVRGGGGILHLTSPGTSLGSLGDGSMGKVEVQGAR